jgi:hypothetical protein
MSTTSIPQETKDAFKTLRFSRKSTCLVLKINDLTILVDEEISLEDIELPNQPRFLIISLEFKHSDGRVSFPLCGIYYNPDSSSMQQRMVYASSVNLVTQEAGIPKMFELVDPDDFNYDWVCAQLKTIMTRP